ncbi:stathmin domain-containing protein 1 [Periophthalmus magnuspinnatus]|uniref:stathmin domain-containing protein 1 n=1 Tax=Periophthalmus magnuspinnatus TaxID=409849 RepID=UPI002436E636|nr:stathmin domain-containing protein 1 [Periophthalmus magnuspinnatus]
MGCCSSTSTAVIRPFTPEKLQGDEDETGSKHSSRGDSAVSKSTTDSGVVMENREVPTLPGAVPRNLPPLTSAAVSPPLLRWDSQTHEHQKSSEILEELLTQGIIPVGPSRENSGAAGEAYSIMLNDREGTLRKPPARLESLKENKTQLSKEAIDEKIRLAEERRKQKEDEMKSRLRAKSALVRVPARCPSSGEEQDPIEQLLAPTQGSQPAEEGAEAEREATPSSHRSRNTQEKQEESADVKERGENDVVTITQDGELSDSSDSDVSFQLATAQDERF